MRKWKTDITKRVLTYRPEKKYDVLEGKRLKVGELCVPSFRRVFFILKSIESVLMYSAMGRKLAKLNIQSSLVVVLQSITLPDRSSKVLDRTAVEVTLTQFESFEAIMGVFYGVSAHRALEQTAVLKGGYSVACHPRWTWGSDCASLRP